MFAGAGSGEKPTWTPWTTLAPIDKDREYLALLSYLPLKSTLRSRVFLRFSLRIQQHMRKSAGAAGYSMRAKPFSRRFWRLSVWEDESALAEFVERAPHRGQRKFTQWKASGSAIPLVWDEAIRRISGER